jgi:parvulin-like peptidyl-prolyl isomerase
MIESLRMLPGRSVTWILTAFIVGCPVSSAIAAPSNPASKAAQCDTLLAVVNQGEALSQKFDAASAQMDQKGKGVTTIEGFRNMTQEMAGQFTALTADLEQYTQKVRTVQVEDKTLIGLRDRSVQNYQDLAIALKDMTRSLQQLSSPQTSSEMISPIVEEMDGQSKQMDVLTLKEEKITQEFNKYCGFPATAK